MFFLNLKKRTIRILEHRTSGRQWHVDTQRRCTQRLVILFAVTVSGSASHEAMQSSWVLMRVII